eukprot:763392-Hanusia_phi.AAC.9
MSVMSLTQLNVMCARSILFVVHRKLKLSIFAAARSLNTRQRSWKSETGGESSEEEGRGGEKENESGRNQGARLQQHGV